jgi:GNAT superfamily N-acetyltransferase
MLAQRSDDAWPCQHQVVDTERPGHLRPARAGDIVALLPLWEALYAEVGAGPGSAWPAHAREWFARAVDDSATTRIPVVVSGEEIVATAIGTLELGVPNPHCARGRAVRLANVITRPDHRGRGWGTALVRDVIAWARSVDADRVDLSTSPDGRPVYERLGFTVTSAPRMKLVL